MNIYLNNAMEKALAEFLKHTVIYTEEQWRFQEFQKWGWVRILAV